MSCGMLAEQDDLTMEESRTQTGKEEHGGEAVRGTMGRNMGGGGGYTNVTNAKDKGGMCI